MSTPTQSLPDITTPDLDPARLARIRQAATEGLDDLRLYGRWGWFGSARSNQYLATVCGGRTYVMRFTRLGMASAQPMFPHRSAGDTFSGLAKGRDLAVEAGAR